MPSITVKHIPQDLYDRVKMSAAAHRRSINSEIIICLEQAVGGQPFDVDGALAAARVLRERTAGYVTTDDDFTAAKERGRP